MVSALERLAPKDKRKQEESAL